MTTITREQVQKIIDAADEVITALAGTNEDVHPDNSQEMIRLYDDLNDHYAPPEVVRELARIALASLNATPIYQVQYGQQWRDVSKEVYGDHRDHGSSTRIVYAEPVSQTYELPQTQLEQVADLYEMQFDDGRTCAFHTDGAKAAQWLLACDGNKVQEYVRIERYQEAVIGNSPVTPDGWISCSERMPPTNVAVLVCVNGVVQKSVFCWDGESWGDWYDEYDELAQTTFTHWMPLPEPPQEVNRG